MAHIVFAVWGVSDFKTDLLVWISSILDHLGTIGTGGILVLLIQLAKEKWPAHFTWQFSRRVFLVFLLFAIFQSWEGEYLSRLGREKDLINAHAEIDGLRRDITFQAQDIRRGDELAKNTIEAACAVKEGINQTLEKQNRDEQVLISGCQSEALKLLTPSEQKTTPIPFDNSFKSVGVRTMRWIVMTNKTKTPVDLIASCGVGTYSIESAELKILGAGAGSVMFAAAAGGRLTDSAWELTNPGSWSPESPLFVTIDYIGQEGTSCSFSPR